MMMMMMMKMMEMKMMEMKMKMKMIKMMWWMYFQKHDRKKYEQLLRLRDSEEMKKKR